jgi:hypothetical protein
MDDLHRLNVPEAIRTLLRNAGIRTIAEVRMRCELSTLQDLPGVGRATEDKIRAAMTGLEHLLRSDPFVWLYVCGGAVALVIAMVLAVWAFTKDSLTGNQYLVLFWCLPLCSGIVAGCFCGSITTRSTSRLKGLEIAAAGGFAVWLITCIRSRADLV